MRRGSSGDSADPIAALAESSTDRVSLWRGLANEQAITAMAEIGVFRGAFSAAMLDGCPSITDYYMIDPWRHLDDWNKPANSDDERFERILRKAMKVTATHERRRRVLRGRTTEVIDQIDDGALDLVYVDGDHTLRGISIDLICAEPKVKPGGWLGGDDLSPSIWQHGDEFEPSMVFPFAVHFAEAHGHPFYALPFNQFVIHKTALGFESHDLTGRYPTTELLTQILNPRKRRKGGGRRGKSDVGPEGRGRQRRRAQLQARGAAAAGVRADGSQGKAG